MMEEWRFIPGYGTRYSVSSIGRVRANHSGISGRVVILADFRQCRKKYRRVNLYDATGKLRQWGVHQLVAIAFLGPVPDGHEVNHKDTNHANNRLDNLEYVTPRQNIDHAVAAGVMPRMRGETNGTAKLSDLDAIDIKTCIDIGCPDWELAAVYGVSLTTISLIRRGKAWKHVRAWRLGEANEPHPSEQRMRYADRLAERALA
jgi:hypothetical protein